MQMFSNWYKDNPLSGDSIEEEYWNSAKHGKKFDRLSGNRLTIRFCVTVKLNPMYDMLL